MTSTGNKQSRSRIHERAHQLSRRGIATRKGALIDCIRRPSGPSAEAKDFQLGRDVYGYRAQRNNRVTVYMNLRSLNAQFRRSLDRHREFNADPGRSRQQLERRRSGTRYITSVLAWSHQRTRMQGLVWAEVDGFLAGRTPWYIKSRGTIRIH